MMSILFYMIDISVISKYNLNEIRLKTIIAEKYLNRNSEKWEWFN